MKTMIALAMALASVLGTPETAPPNAATAQPADAVAGSWIGEFAGADWTFELNRDGAAWTGRYRSTAGKGWQPLQGVAVSGRSATFNIASQPQLTFALNLNAAGDALSGDLRIAGHMTLPFSATRTRSPA